MQQWDFYGPEQRDGLRFSWNVWPSTRLEATRIMAPIGCMYSPLKRIENMPDSLQYDPIRCNGCSAVLNPFVQVDFRSKVWTCAFCSARNHFPPHYAENISETSLPAELIPHFSTVEYELPASALAPAGPPVFLFLIDVCADEEELAALRDALLQTLNLLPEQALVGLVTFGTLINVFELGFADCAKAFVLRGEKEYPAAKIAEMLGIAPARGPGGAGRGALGRFFLPVADCIFAVEQVLEDLTRDPWPAAADERPARCSGQALAVAVALLEAAAPRQGSRVLLFASGPCTTGPGAVAAKSRKVPLRSHLDLAKGQAPLAKPATDYYAALAERCQNAFIAVDLFACALDQIGALEMRPLVARTGGLMVLADKFAQSMFRESLKRVFERPDGGDLAMGFGAAVEVLCSRDVKVQGCVGPCASLKKKSACVADSELGVGGTSAWFLGAVDPALTLAFFFDVTATAPAQGSTSTAGPAPPRRRVLQFLTSYLTAAGRQRLRVTTCAGPFQPDPADASALAQGFDQEACAALLARLVVYRMESTAEEVADAMRFLDRSLIRLAAKFASYRKDDPSSFRLPAEFALLPQFVFHLRRSKFLQTFNCSPDEQAFYRHTLCRESVSNSVIMLQPSLLAYSFQGPPQPVLLDATSVRPDVILLLDSFFHVIVFHGETVAAWKAQGYHNLEEHANFRNLLNAPQQDAQAILKTRFPIPRFIVCDQHKSEARFLLAMLNPSVTHHTDGAGGVGGGQTIFTDDVSLRVFMEHLMKLAVQS